MNQVTVEAPVLHEPVDNWTITYENSGARGPLDSLSKSCGQLRNEIAAWAEREEALSNGKLMITRSFGIIHKSYNAFRFVFSEKTVSAAAISDIRRGSATSFHDFNRKSN